MEFAFSCTVISYKKEQKKMQCETLSGMSFSNEMSLFLA